MPFGFIAVPAGFKFAKRIFTVPAQKRAAGPAAQLVESANAGNVTAAAAILYRTGIGVMRERAVWQAALQKLSSDMVLVAQQKARQLLPLVDHSTPATAARTALANVRDVSSFASQTSARVTRPTTPKADKQVSPVAPVRAARGRGRGRAAAAPRARAVRKVWRYDPDTHRRIQVPADSVEAAEWSSRKPRRNAALGRATRHFETAAATGIASGGLKLAGAIKAAGAAAGIGITATGAAIVGAFGVGFAIGTGINKLAAYLSTSERNARKALAFRAARLRFAQDNGRAMSAAEVRELGAGFKASLTR